MFWSSSSNKAQGKNDDDSEEDDPKSSYSRGYEALEEEEEDSFEQEEEEAFLVASILLAMQKSSFCSNVAAPKEDGVSGKRCREDNRNFWIPQYHAESKSDDTEGVDENLYNMSVLQIDESLFGRQKYHKGNKIESTFHLFLN